MRLCFSFFSRALYINLLGLCSFLVCSLFAGMCLYSIYKNCDPLMAGQISSHDQVWWRDAQQSWELWLSVLLGLIRTGLHKAGHYDLKSILQLKHQYVTLIVTGSFENQLNNARLSVAQNSNLTETGSYFVEKMSSGWPSDVPPLLCPSAAFYLAELSAMTTRCCSCSFGLQAAYMLLSGTSMNHRVEAEQS